jgi:hypothetical protein
MSYRDILGNITHPYREHFHPRFPTAAPLWHYLNRKYGPFGLNALHYTAGTFSLENTCRLLDAGVEVNVKDDRGNTALMLAVAEGGEEMIRLLLFGIETTDKSVG